MCSGTDVLISSANKSVPTAHHVHVPAQNGGGIRGKPHGRLQGGPHLSEGMSGRVRSNKGMSHFMSHFSACVAGSDQSKAHDMRHTFITLFCSRRVL